MKRLRKNISQNHLYALTAVYRLINATSDAVAKSQNMPARRDYWKRYLNDLALEGMVISRKVSYTSRTGKNGSQLGEFFALTRHGAETIAETLNIEPESIFYPHGGIQSKSPFQFPHRALLIQLLSMFLAHEKKNSESFEILDIVPEYRYIGANRHGTGHKATRVTLPDDSAIIPDAIIRFRTGGETRLAVIEFHRETPAGRVLEQLEKHSIAMRKKMFSSMFNHHATNYVLSVYDDADKLKTVISRIRAGEFAGFDKVSNGFHFATLDDIFLLGIDKAFYQVDKTESTIFY